MFALPALDPALLLTIQSAQTGDAVAFETLVELYRPSVLKLLQRRLRNIEDAEDAAQLIFFQLHRKLPALRNPAAFNAWLCALVRCRAATQLRRRRRDTAELEGIPEPAAAAPQLENSERKLELAQSIEHLAEPLRSTTRLFYLDGLSTREISKLTGSPLGTVKRRLHSARKQLVPSRVDKFEI